VTLWDLVKSHLPKKENNNVSASVNRVILIGNLGADPELKYTPNGARPVCSLRIATSEVWKDKSGQKQEKVEWHRVTVWGDQAEHCSKYLAKGRSVYVEGRLETRSWDDKDGSKRYSTEVVAERVKFLGGGKDKPAEPFAGTVPPPGDDDVPF